MEYQYAFVSVCIVHAHGDGSVHVCVSGACVCVCVFKGGVSGWAEDMCIHVNAHVIKKEGETRLVTFTHILEHDSWSRRMLFSMFKAMLMLCVSD